MEEVGDAVDLNSALARPPVPFSLLPKVEGNSSLLARAAIEDCVGRNEVLGKRLLPLVPFILSTMPIARPEILL
jgi:hypothetical protein